MMQKIHLLQNNDDAKSETDTDYQLNNDRTLTKQLFIAATNRQVQTPFPENIQYEPKH